MQTTAYNPNTNGICERTNDTIKRIVKKYVNKGHKDWDCFISKAVFSINTTAHSVTKFSPFFLAFNRQPNLRADNLLPTNNEFADENPVDLNSRHINALQEAYINTVSHQEKCKQKFDLLHPPKSYAIGEKVLLANFQKVVGLVSKWLVKWCGPYAVIDQLGPITYRIVDD